MTVHNRFEQLQYVTVLGCDAGCRGSRLRSTTCQVFASPWIVAFFTSPPHCRSQERRPDIRTWPDNAGSGMKMNEDE